MSPRPLGQHFLNDRNIIDKILGAACLSETDQILEIGPGRGALTKELVKKAGHVTAVELDSKLAAALPPHPRLTVVEKNFLKCNLTELLPGPPHSWKVIANLPYYITTPIIEKLLLESDQQLDCLIIMIQKEVADRMAITADRQSSALSYFVQYYSQVKTLFKVAPGCFNPPPRVDSAVVKMTIHRTPPVAAPPADLFAVTRTAFAERRKTLRRSLRSLAQSRGADILEVLQKANINAERRPETLTIEEFSQIALALPRAF